MHHTSTTFLSRLWSYLPALILPFLTLCMVNTHAANALKVHSVKGTVKVSSGGKISPVATGMILTKTDLLSIPEGASIEIRDEVNNTIYSSTTGGNTSVGMLIARSASKAGNNSANINSRLKFSERGKKVAVGSRVYREKGMVTRSLNLFDTEASDVEIAPEALAQLIANTVYFGNLNGDSTLVFSPLHIEAIPPVPEKNEIGFKLHNPLETPVYFNVLRISGVQKRVAEISPLGQPSGSYVLPAGQTMWRAQTGAFPYGEQHLIVACHYSFDIDALIEALNKIINDDMLIIEDPDPTLPVFIRVI